MSDATRRRLHRIRDYVVERDGLICCYCDKVLTPKTLTLDHIIPDSMHGSFNATNLTVACVKCNQKRGAIPFFEFCKQFQWPQDKIDKYKRLCSANIRIKVLN